MILSCAPFARARRGRCETYVLPPELRNIHFVAAHQSALSLLSSPLVHGPLSPDISMISLHSRPRDMHAAIRFTSIATYLFLPSPRLWAKGHTPLAKQFTFHGHAEAAENCVFPFVSFVALIRRVLARHQSPSGKMNAPSAA